MRKVIRKKFDLVVPESIRVLHRIFVDAGYKLYLVGGVVRDCLVSHFYSKPFAPKDYDLVTDALPDVVEELLVDYSCRGVGKSFGIVLVTVDGEDYEIATFREDARSGDGRRPDYVVFSTIDMDADRRDLTVNALYYDLDSNEVLDFHSGIEDIGFNCVRFVGNATDRLIEDKLRALRYVRFQARMSSYLDKEAELAIKNCVLRPEISEERIRDEFLKGLKSAVSVQDFIFVLDRLGLLQQVFPGFNINLSVISSNLDVVIAYLLKGNKDVRNKLLALKYTVEEAQNVEFLLKLGDYQEDDIVKFKKDRKRCSMTDQEILDVAYGFATKVELLKEFISYPYPMVRGQDLMDQFQGKELGLEIERREIECFRNFLGRD
jgi:tRNA nucleotidyltransferase/poly(A) polymerase